MSNVEPYPSALISMEMVKLIVDDLIAQDPPGANEADRFARYRAAADLAAEQQIFDPNQADETIDEYLQQIDGWDTSIPDYERRLRELRVLAVRHRRYASYDAKGFRGFIDHVGKEPAEPGKPTFW